MNSRVGVRDGSERSLVLEVGLIRVDEDLQRTTRPSAPLSFLFRALSRLSRTHVVLGHGVTSLKSSLNRILDAIKVVALDEDLSAESGVDRRGLD